MVFFSIDPSLFIVLIAEMIEIINVAEMQTIAANPNTNRHAVRLGGSSCELPAHPIATATSAEILETLPNTESHSTIDFEEVLFSVEFIKRT